MAEGRSKEGVWARCGWDMDCPPREQKTVCMLQEGWWQSLIKTPLGTQEGQMHPSGLQPNINSG